MQEFQYPASRGFLVAPLCPGGRISNLCAKPSDTLISAVQAPVVQKLPDSAIDRITLYPVDNEIGFPSTYALDSNLSGG